MDALVVFAICCLYTAQAKPGHHDDHSLHGIPDLNSYANIMYPSFDIQDLGTSVHGDIPPKIVQIHESITIKEPQPYPVQVPHHVPYPVHVPHPIPVQVTKLVHVPKSVPVEVVKTVHVPVEVPKPYPVPSLESSGGDHGGYGASLESQGGGFGGHQQGPISHQDFGLDHY